MYVFIDTNIYLSFYHYSSDDLEQLKKLHVTITSGPIILVTTNNLKDEFARNRENKIADALKQFRENKFPKKFPELFKDFPEYQTIKESVRGFEQATDALLNKLQASVHDKTLRADDEVEFLFSHSVNLENGASIIEKARLRRELRQPPGKKDSMGDAINWEALLQDVPDGEELYLISGDVDYRSPLNPKSLAEYLREEWETKKSSKIYFFDKLSDFFTSQYPDIKLASELERTLAVSNLISSGNFSRTHRSILKLNVADLTESEGVDILNAYLENAQIYWIADDEDVNLFGQELFAAFGRLLSREQRARFVELYCKEEESLGLDTPISLDDIDIPFWRIG